MKKKYTSYALVLLIFIIVPTALAMMMKMTEESEEPREGIPHNYWVPDDLELKIDWDSLEEVDPDMMYLRPDDEDIMLLDTVLDQVQNIEKDLDTCFYRIERIETKLDELIEDRNEKQSNR